LKKQLIGSGYRVSVAKQEKEAIESFSLEGYDSYCINRFEMPILNVWNDLTLGSTSDATENFGNIFVIAVSVFISFF